jgi:hypothetical protein
MVALGWMRSLIREGSQGENILHGDGCRLNYFDTADLYNKGENEMSNAFREKKKLILATKAETNGEMMDRCTGILQKNISCFRHLVLNDYKPIILIYTNCGGTIEDPIDDDRSI